MDFKVQFNNYINEINEHLEKCFEKCDGKIYEAMKYSLFAGGKRIRPVLSLAVSEAFGGNYEAAMCFGCAVEMIHTYSLIHDDLPCMDNDDLRRGKPTNHIVFGEDLAVLAGDALLNFACESISFNNNINDSSKVKAMQILFSASGAEGMIGGQVIDMMSENVSLEEKMLRTLHEKKTGALIKASVALGAVSAEKPSDILDEYASSLGLAFQIRDDILDVEGNIETFGKPIHSDEKNCKTTYVSLYGIAGAKELLNKETDKAIRALDSLGSKAEFLRMLALYLLNREN